MNGIASSPTILDKYGYLASQQAAAANEKDDNVFLKILVSQLQNQNPLEPLDNGEFIQQMASFTEVEEASILNEQIGALVQLQQLLAGQAAFSQSANLVGKTVTYLHPETGEELTGFVKSVKVDESGLILDIDGTSVLVSSVTGMIADGTDSDGSDSSDNDEESGDGSSENDDEN